MARDTRSIKTVTNDRRSGCKAVTRGLRRLREWFTGAARSRGPRTRLMFSRWAMFYRSFAQRRFVALSRGGGEWPPLKKDRKRDIKAQQRRRKINNRRVRQFMSGEIDKLKVLDIRQSAILRDTGTLFAVLDPSGQSDGALELLDGDGVIVGYGGSEIHPTGSRLTIAKIAEFHQLGNSRLPQRRIIVEPDNKCLGLMRTEVNRHNRDLIKEAANDNANTR